MRAQTHGRARARRTTPARPRLHFSFRSPFSWMAITRLVREVPDAYDRIEFIPYWNPDAQTESALHERGAEFHYTQMSKAKHLYILHDTRRQAERLGLRMVWPIDDDPWWELPHLGWLAARRVGRAAEFTTAVMAARWERGEDVCDERVIRRVGAAAGVDGDLLVGAPHSEEIRAEGVDCLVRAYEDDIFGIPYFRLGRHRFWGLDRVDDFLAALSVALATDPAGTAGAATGPSGLPGSPGSSGPPVPDPGLDRNPVPARALDRVGSFDTDTAGGCG